MNITLKILNIIFKSFQVVSFGYTAGESYNYQAVGDEKNALIYLICALPILGAYVIEILITNKQGGLR